MSKFKLMQIDPLSKKELRAAGYQPYVYYCGNDQWKKFYTLVRDKLQGLGVPFPLNESCFIHDIHYGEIWVENPGLFKSIYYKVKADIIFNANMKALLDAYLQEHGAVLTLKHLQRRRKAYFLIVLTAGTVGYAAALIWRKVRKNDKK